MQAHGALGLEALSRGAKKSIFCDKSYKAIDIIKKNIEKTKFEEKATIYKTDYSECLNKISNNNSKLDIIFIDPPYDSNLIYLSIKKIIDLELLNKDGIIIAETDH